MRVVVTGAAGFIGSALVAALSARGCSVLGIDRRAVPGTDALRADLNDDNSAVTKTLATADAVFHLAAAPGVRGGPDAEHRRQRDNAEATARVLAAVPLSTPLIVTSSSSVYGGCSDRASNEADIPSPRGGYAASKLAVERLCAKRVSHGGHVAVVRPFTVIGEGQRSDMAFARWLSAATTGAPLRVYGGLDRGRDMTDVRDVVEGLIRALDRGVRATVNLGTGVPISLADAIAAVAAVTSSTPEIVVTPAHRDDPAHTRADTRRCAQLLGFVPSTDLTGVLQRQLAAMHAAELEAA